MTKMEKDYIDRYGGIQDDIYSRIAFITNGKNLKTIMKKLNEAIKTINSIRWNTLSFTIYMVPQATPRPRSGHGVFYVKGASANKKFFLKHVKKYLKEKDINIIATPVKFYCTAYFPIPRSMSIVEKICAELGYIKPISKPDWDNVAKTYCDMIQGSILYDDALIIEGTSEKRYSVKPRIEITVKYMEGYDCKFNERKIKKQKGGILGESDIYED